MIKILNHTDTVMSSFLSSSILPLCFLSMILFKLKIMFLTLGSISLFSIKISKTLYVKRFWDKFNVITLAKYGSIFTIQSSESLLRMNFIVFILVPGMN